MSGLVIDDGNPWYLSPNIWVVSIHRPNDPGPGELSPIAGKQYYVKANVRNTERYRIEDAQVNFYWTNPSLSINRQNVHEIGVAFASVDAGATVEALCLVPWTPMFVNQGHECLITEVFKGNLPSGTLDPQNEPQVAQRNISVVQAFSAPVRGFFYFTFEVCNPARRTPAFTINARQANQDQLEAVIKQFAPKMQPLKLGAIRDLGFVPSPSPNEHVLKDAAPQVGPLKLAENECTGYSLIGTLEGEVALVHVTQTIDDRVVGGLGVLIHQMQGENR